MATTAPSTDIARPSVIEGEAQISKADFKNVQMESITSSAGMKLAITSYAELEKFAHLMSISMFVPKHLRGKPADCVAILMQAMRWEMDPFAVASKTYFVNDGIGYEAQLVNALVLSRAPIEGRPKFKWEGLNEDMTCTVSATFKGNDEPSEYTAVLKTITTRNSPLWKQQPAQQLGYFAMRAWARIYCPDVIMGVYTREEREEGFAPDQSDGVVTIEHQPSQEEQEAIDKANAMMEELGWNAGKQNMARGSYRGQPDSLIEYLEGELKKHRRTSKPRAEKAKAEPEVKTEEPGPEAKQEPETAFNEQPKQEVTEEKKQPVTDKFSF